MAKKKSKRVPKPRRVLLPRPDWYEKTAERYLNHITGKGTNINESITWITARNMLVDLRFDRMYLHLQSFYESVITNCSFVDADLRSADFTGAWLVNCDFTGADLRSACFVDATLTNCTLEHAATEGANFRTSAELDAMWSNPQARSALAEAEEDE